MIILSKYKDYYDYLTGIYGRDEKLILDRRKGYIEKFQYRTDPEAFRIHICGISYDLLMDKSITYFGEDLKKFGKIYRNSAGEYISIRTDRDRFARYINLMLSPQKSKINEEKNCPIVLQFIGEYGLSERLENFPRLIDFNFGQILSPEDIYIQLTNWISREEIVTNNQTDIEKIESHGFDKKTSFRPKIKK